MLVGAWAEGMTFGDAVGRSTQVFSEGVERGLPRHCFVDSEPTQRPRDYPGAPRGSSQKEDLELGNE